MLNAYLNIKIRLCIYITENVYNNLKHPPVEDEIVHGMQKLKAYIQFKGKRRLLQELQK